MLVLVALLIALVTGTNASSGSISGIPTVSTNDVGSGYPTAVTNDIGSGYPTYSTVPVKNDIGSGYPTHS